MKKCASTAALALAAFAIGAAPAAAQLGGLSGALKKAETVKKVADIKVTDAEEQQIGQEVSAKIVQEFGVLQDKEVARYVTLLGAVLAQAANRSTPGIAILTLRGENCVAFGREFMNFLD